MSGCMVLDLDQAYNCIWDDLWSVLWLDGLNVAVFGCIGLKSRCMIWIVVDHGSSPGVVGGGGKGIGAVGLHFNFRTLTWESPYLLHFDTNLIFQPRTERTHRGGVCFHRKIRSHI